MELKLKTLLLLLLLSTALVSSGCATKPIVLHPITGADIFEVPEGTMVGEIRTVKPGWFVSDFYITEIMKANVR